MPPFTTDFLVWVDCEMTGLGSHGGPDPDTLLEVACLVTDGNLNPVTSDNLDIVISHPDETLDKMHDWCKTQFGWKGIGQDCEPNGLADMVRKSTITLEEADNRLFKFVQHHVKSGPKTAILAGNTVHMDKRFLDKYCPKFMDFLHYRIVDVSTIKELCKRWKPEEFSRVPKKKGSHRALNDILESIEELKYYRETIFRE